MKKERKDLFDITNEAEVSKFIDLINDFKITYRQIAQIYGYKSSNVVYNMIKKLNIKKPDRQSLRDKLFLSGRDNSDKNSFDVVALAPLKYSPEVRVIRCGTRNNIHYYVPELNKLVTDHSLEKLLNKIGIKLFEWECRWFLKLDKDLISTETWANKVIEVFYNDKKENTKTFIKTQLLIDPSFKFNYLMVKEDLISDIKIVCNSKKNLINVLDKIDLNSLPDFIKNVTEPFELKDLNGKTFSTSYFNFVVKGFNPLKSTSRLKSLDEFKKESEDKFGKGRFEILSDYLGRNLYITIKCNSCGNIFKTTPATHLSSIWGGCEICCNYNSSINRSFSKEEFQNRIDSIYGPGKYECISEYKNMKSSVTILNLETNEISEQDPENILYHSIVNNNFKKSSGEYLTKLWLLNNKINYSEQVKISEIEGRNFNSYVIIDFILTFSNRKIWIEYNGKQHYVYSSRFNNFDIKELEKQKTRDNNIRVYCKENSIELIEIPYILNSYKSISIFLTKTILNSINPLDIIDYNKIYEGYSTIKSIDKLNIF